MRWSRSLSQRPAVRTCWHELTKSQAGHNDIELHDVWMDRLVSFVLTLDAAPLSSTA